MEHVPLKKVEGGGLAGVSHTYLLHLLTLDIAFFPGQHVWYG